ncbi:DUF3102 domain-containing protein [Anaerotignum propionicum]|uniref:DUF3102 domain-containing protein n=1 Tax=Anaerotignum propionicum TaxID=28446 RepID=UPI00289DE351|nr:DUF3102 domain-containing protein [Anaerotignum propionicum]
MDELTMGNQCELDNRPIEVITQEIQFYKGQATMAIIEIGRRLEEAKIRIPHGQWGDWLKNEVQFSERTAQNFMRIAREYPNPQTVAVLGNSMSKALALLTLPSEEREEFLQETHVIDGEEKTVADMSTREMERLVKELEAERKAKGELQLRIDSLEMEAAQATIEDTPSEELLQAEEKQREAEEKVAALQAELEVARSEPQPAVEDSVLEQVRKDAEEKAQEKLKKKIQKAEKEAEKAKKEAEEAKRKLQEKEDVISLKVSQAEKIAEQKEQAIQDLQKKLAMAGDSKIATFKVHFEGVQGQINKMLDCIEELNQEDSEGAGKLKAALKKLCEGVLEELGE